MFNSLLTRVALPLPILAVTRLALADSGIGVDTWHANKLDPTGVTSGWLCDPRGTSWLYPGESRSPSSDLYHCPPELPPPDHAADWEFSGVLQLGYQGVGGDQVASWDRYAAWANDAPIGSLDLSAQRAADGSYAELRASRISDEDQYYQAVYGKAGAYKVQSFYRDLPNILSTDARALWNGAGGNNLTLPNGLAPGGSTVAQVAAASAARPISTLKVTRSKEGLSLSTYLSPRWTAYADFSDEQRAGTRPYGGSFFFDYLSPLLAGAVMETVKPIDDHTINIDGGLRYAGSSWRLDISYTGSFYRDRYKAYYYQSPFALTPFTSLFPASEQPAVSAPIYQGQMSTEPDNEYHNLQVALTRKIALDGELSITGRYGTMLQNDALIAPIDCQGVFGIGLNGSLQLGPQNPHLFSCSNWNTTAALSRQTADMSIDLSTIDTRVLLRPSADWMVRAGVRLDRQDYPGTYLAYNPLTKQYGYVSENGSQGGIVPGEVGFVDANNSAEPTQIRSIPLGSRTAAANLGADWTLSEHDTVGATLEFSRYDPQNREVARVDDGDVKLDWTNRSFRWLTLRVSYQYSHRSGDDYNSEPYAFAYSSSLPGYVAPATGTPSLTVDAERKYDISERNEHKVDVMATIAPREELTVTGSLRGDWNTYGTTIGRTGYDTVNASLQTEWHVEAGTSASVYVAWDRSRLAFSNVQDQQNGVGSDPALGGPNYALLGQWWLTDGQSDYYGGVTFKRQMRGARLDLTWNYIYSRGVDQYSYAGSSALAYPSSVATADPGSGAYPAMTYRVSSFTASLAIPVADRLLLRLYDNYEIGRISDWHYDGFDQGLVVGQRLYTDAGPQSYNANVVGVMFYLRL